MSVQTRVVLQRAQQAQVFIEGKSQGLVPHGFMLLVGFGAPSSPNWEEDYLSPKDFFQKYRSTLQKLVTKILALRVFEDSDGKMNLCLGNIPNAGVYAVSQFTLFGTCKKGNRPSFTGALKPEYAKPLYQMFVDELKLQAEKQNLTVCTGEFGAEMHLDFVNNGPVTLILEANEKGLL